MPRGRKAETLYSVWRNSDDRLIILDGTAEQCCSVMGITKNSFYKLMCASYGDDKYTIRKITRKQSKREEDS